MIHFRVPTASIRTLLASGIQLALVATFCVAGCKSTDTDRIVQAGPPIALFSSTTLDFGEVNCGTTAAANGITLANPGGSAFKFTASLAKGAGSAFAIEPSSGEVAAGGSVTINVTPRAIPTTASTAENAFGDVLSVFTNITGSAPTTIPLRQRARGAELSFASPQVAFGAVSLNSTQTTLALRNSGNAPARVSLQSSSGAFGVSGAASDLAGGAVVDTFVTFTPPGLSGTSGLLTMTASEGDVLCRPLPSPLVVSGSGTASGIDASPATVQFGDAGLVDCGQAATPQSITLSNVTALPTTFSATLGKGALSNFTLSVYNGVIPANGSTTVAVIPKPIPPTSLTTLGLYNDAVTITTNGLNDSPHVVALQMSARGAIIARATGSIGFGNVGVAGTSQSVFTLSNQGNIDYVVDHVLAAPFTLPAPITVPAGGNVVVPVSFTPAALQAYADSAVLVPAASETRSRCANLPAALTLSGTGVQNTLTAFPGSLNFGSVNCGTQGGVQSVQIKNNGPAGVLNLDLLKGRGTVFELRDTDDNVLANSLPMTAGESVTIQVEPLAIPALAPVTNNFFGDTLLATFVPTPAGAQIATLSITLTQGARGVILEFRNNVGSAASTGIAFGNLAVAAAASRQYFSVINNGNMPLGEAVPLIITGHPDFTLDNEPAGGAVQVNAGLLNSVAQPFSLTFDSSSTGARSTTITLDTSALTTPFCGVSPIAPFISTGSGT